jgi:hypothetical protein
MPKAIAQAFFGPTAQVDLEGLRHGVKKSDRSIEEHARCKKAWEK